MTDKIDIEEVNKIPPFTFETITIDLSKIKLSVDDTIKIWSNYKINEI